MSELLSNQATSRFIGLTGKLLISMPYCQDARFERSVIFICGHDIHGTIGLVINKALPQPTTRSFLDQLGIIEEGPTFPLMYGGPVETTRGFVLHGDDCVLSTDVKVTDQFFVSSTIDVLRSIVTEHRPADYLVCLGYTGWGEGQLEKEIQDNLWLIADATPALLFFEKPEDKWQASLATLRINPRALSLEGGHA